MREYVRGVKCGIPIALGYLSVSFTFGIMASRLGFTAVQAILISMTTLTSAGQLAAIEIMTMPHRFMEMLITQATINARYSFMSISLSQKVSKNFGRFLRVLLGFFMTDEIFAVAQDQEEVRPSFFIGLSTLPYFGWATGTLLGAIIGDILPDMIMEALLLGMYCMFVAILVPKAKASRSVTCVILIASAINSITCYIPPFTMIPQGFAVSISAIIAATVGALIFPIETKEDNQ